MQSRTVLERETSAQGKPNYLLGETEPLGVIAQNNAVTMAKWSQLFSNVLF